MGKILTYLKISEDNQSRDVLDAERLLEGMQAIYAVSPSGSKKDNFAIPLAEMTKIFIEKVKGITPKEEPKEEPKQELNFKVGDVFKQAVGEEYEKDYGISTFTILSIDEEKQVVKIGRKNLKTLKTLEFERAISKVFDDVDTKWWIPYENEDSFKVGDMFYVTKEGKEKTYQVIYIDGQNFTFVRGNDGNIESYEGLYTTDEANLKLKEGRWTKVLDQQREEPKQDELKFKTGDKFKMLISTNQKYQVTDISGDRFSFKMDDGINVYTTIYTTSEANAKLKEGSWVKILDEQKEEGQFKIGDKYLNKTVKDTFTITQVYTDFIDVKFNGGNEATYDILFGKEKVVDGTWVKVLDEEKEEPKDQDFTYKVGDEFHVPSLDEYFNIIEIGNDIVKFKYSSDGRVFNLTKETFLERVNTDKTFIPVLKKYKVGDKFLWAKEDITFVIDFIKNGELGIIYSDGLTGFLSTEQFEKGLSTGYYKPYTEEAKPEEKKPRKPRQPRTKSEQDKKIEHILDINLDEIQF
jgi:hypothetical protein